MALRPEEAHVAAKTLYPAPEVFFVFAGEVDYFGVRRPISDLSFSTNFFSESGSVKVNSTTA